MAKIELNIVATGEFSQVTSQIKALQAQVDILNKSVAGVGVGSAMAKDMQLASAAFQSTMLSTGQFTMSTVKMTSETEKFGQALVSGKLKLSDYFQIITGKAGQATASLAALTAEQVKLQESVVVSDPTKKGFLQVYTPTTINSVTSATKLATMQQNLYNLSVDAGSKALINWGKNTQWAGRQLTVGLTMPMVMFGAAAVKSFKDTNAELTRLQRLYGEGLTPPSQAQLNQISSQVLELGKQIAQQMGIAQTETTKVAANFAAMGKQGQDLLDITKQTQRLSKLGGVDATAATNAIVALQNVYRVSTNDLANAVNFLSDMQKQTTMSLGDMTDAIPRVGPIMQQLGGTYKDTAVMLLAMKEAGVPAAQAANALKSAMASIIAPTRTATDAASKFGISLDAVKNAGTPVQMIEKLQEGMAKLAPLAKEQLIEKIFGKFQFARISALLDNFGRVGSQTQNALKVAGATNQQLADLANQEMKQATESTTARYQRALEGFKSTLYPIGQEFLKIGAIVLNIANKIGDAFSKLPSPVKTVLGIMAGFAVFAGPVIMLTGLLANFAGYILKGVVNFKQLVSGGKSFKELLTPEIIASTNATQIFGKAMNDDVAAVDLLNTAIKNLTTSMEGLVAAMNVGTGITSLRDAVGATATAETTMFRQMALPGFSKGVFSLQAGGAKGKDTIPAVIARGESVISADMTDKYGAVIKAIINDSLPGFSSSLFDAGSGASGIYGKSNFTFAQKYGSNSGHQPFTINSISSSDKAQVANGYAATILENSTTNASAVKEEIKAWQSKNRDLMQEAQNQLRAGVNSTQAYAEVTKKFTEDMKSAGGPVSQFMSKAEEMYPQLAADLEEAQKISTQYNLDLSKAEDTARLLQLAPNNIAAKTMNTPANFQSLAAVRNAATAMGSSNYSETGVPRIFSNGVGTGDSIYSEFTSQGHVARNAIQEQNLAVMQSLRDLGKEAEKQGVYIPEGVAKGMVRGVISSKPQIRTQAFELLAYWKGALGIASPSQVAAEQIGLPFVQGISQGIQEALPGLEAAGQETATTLVTSVGSDLNRAMLDTMISASGMTLEMHQAGMANAEAYHSGWTQGMLGFNDPFQPVIPGLENAGEVAAGKSWVPGESYGPLLPNGQMELSRRESLVNGSVVKSPLIPKSASIGISMGAMAAAPFVSKIGGGSNVIANTAGSVLSNVGMAAMIPMMMPGLNIAMGPFIAAVAATTVAFKGFQMALAQARQDQNSLTQSFQATSTAMQYFGQNVGSLSSYDFSKAGAGLDAHIKSIADNKAAVDALTQAYLNSTDQMTKDRINNLKGMDSNQLTYEMNKQYSSDIAAGFTDKQAQQDINSLMRASGQTAITMASVNQGLQKPTDAGAAFKSNIATAQTAYEKGKGVVSGNALPHMIGGKAGAAAAGFSDAGRAAQSNLANKAKEGDKSYIQTQKVVDGLTSSLQNLATAGVTQVDAALKGLTGTMGQQTSQTLNTDQVYKAYRNNLDKQASGMGALADTFRKHNGTTMQLVEATSLMTSKLVTQKQITDALNGGPGALDKLWNDYKDKIITVEKQTKSTDTSSTSTTTFSGTAEEKATKKLLDGRIKDQNSVLKTLKDQLSIYQKQSAELKRLRDFDAQRQDINNQMKTALISGNYLQAAMLKQSKSALQVDFNTGTMQYKMQDQIDEVQTRADAFNTALGELTNAMNDATIKFDPQWKKTANQAILRPSAINSDLSGGTITQHFTINGGDPNVVYQAVSQATAEASKKQVDGGVKASIKKPGKPPAKPGKK